jgi:hypothetical protein
VEAARFVEPLVREVVEPIAPVRRAPSAEASLDTEALFGERVAVYEITEEGWAWGQLLTDRYVGWLPASALGPPAPEPTHRVSAVRTLVFPGPSIKLPPIAALPFGARLAVTRLEGRFAITSTGVFVPVQHLAATDTHERDFVTVAERFVGTPYLWGGKTGLGIDCSGVVQVALAACGTSCPRDSDMQERALGAPVTNAKDLRRGDLVFWKGHVAVARDAATLIHANAFHMAVAIEPVQEALARIGAAEGAATSIKRLALPP